ncbi:MAG: EscU/YscU/HrcU family type III secretion system export apparatus switch protein [Pseudomonadota bacterium]
MENEHRAGGEPTEPPSPKKLRKARERGEVARSQDFVSWAVFVGVAATLAWIGPRTIGQLREYLQSSLGGAAQAAVTPGAALRVGAEVMVGVLAPVLVVAFVVAGLANFVHVGAVFSLNPIRPDLKRINPTTNARNIFGKNAFFELAKSIIKLGGIAYIAGVVLWDHAPQVLATIGKPPEVILQVVGSSLGAVAMRIGVLAAVLAVADLGYQRFRFRKRQRMTKHEVNREQKEEEGDPQRKAERQRIHREILEYEMFNNVATADCVIINPVRLAAAVRYDRSKESAPIVVARGRRLVATKIREVARANNVPIIRNVPLAQALTELDLNQEIPSELYQAVAEVLRFVYELSGQDV